MPNNFTIQIDIPDLLIVSLKTESIENSPAIAKRYLKRPSAYFDRFNHLNIQRQPDGYYLVTWRRWRYG